MALLGRLAVLIACFLFAQQGIQTQGIESKRFQHRFMRKGSQRFRLQEREALATIHS